MKKKSKLIIPWSIYPGMRKTFMKMKLTCVIILLAGIQLFAVDSYSQSTTLTLKMNNSSVKDVLEQIENQSEFYFLYSSKIIDVDRKVDVELEEKHIDEILSVLFQGTDVLYTVESRQIVLSSTEVSGQKAADEKINIKGTVSSWSGESLPGVSVSVKGTSIGTISDADGKYLINVPYEGAKLLFSFIGFEGQEVTVKGPGEINITMVTTNIDLEEIVAIGYGVQKKSDVTGAVISVSSAEITSRPVNNILEAIQGRAAGVDITTNERPGELGEITIRGVRSLTASNLPLYVVDGIPLMSTGGIETLNPQDIESIDILKDASATAVYGSRGANGVVLVTTKRGSSGELTLNYSGSVTSESMIWRTNYMNSSEFIDFIRWGSYNKSPGDFSQGDQPSLENDAKIELFTADPTAWNNIKKGWANGNWDPSKLESFDWMDQVTQPNLTQEHTLSGSGGTKTMRAYASIGYLDNQGTTKGQEYQRYTVRTSVELSPKEWFEIGASMNSSWTYQDYGQSSTGGSMSSPTSLIFSTAKIYPYALPYDAQGNLIPFPGGQSRVATVIDEWKYSTNQRETMRVMGTFFAQISIVDGLKYRVNFGPDYRNYRNGIYNDGKSVTRGGSSFASYRGNSDFSWTLDNLLYYDKTIGDHAFGATLLQTASNWKHESYEMNAQGIAIESQMWYAMGTVPSLDSWNTGLIERQLSSYMGRFNYSYNDKYLLTLSGRWDGASQLAEGNKWAFFPSAALGWRIDQEDFMKDIDWISQMKMRLGYGSTGNAAVNPYTTKGEINSVQTPFGSSIVTGYTITDAFSNYALGWEKTTQYNLGLDFSIYKGRVSGVIDVYASNTNDLLLTMALPSVSGYISTLANIGMTKNKGIDISLNTINVKTKDFVWESGISAAWQKDEIVSLMNGKEDMVNDILFIGESIESIYNYERLGLWQDTPDDQAQMALFNANGHKFQPGMVKVKDQNGDDKITANDDRIVIGNLRPRFTFGFNNNFSYKNWDLSVFISGRFKYMVNLGESLTGMYGDQRVLDYWTPNNTDAEYQKPFRDEAGGDTYANTYFKDDSYLKIRSISLGYQFPKAICTKMGISNLKVYAQSKNPGMLWSNNNFRDAEYGSIYYNRGLVFGVNVGF